MNSIGHFFIKTSMQGENAEILDDLHYIYRRSQLPVSQDCRDWDEALQAAIVSEFEWVCIYSQWFCGINFNEFHRALSRVPQNEEFYLGVYDAEMPEISILNRSSLLEWMEEFGFLPSYEMVRKLSLLWSLPTTLKETCLSLGQKDIEVLRVHLKQSESQSMRVSNASVERILQRVREDREAANRLLFLVHNESLSLPDPLGFKRDQLAEIATLFSPASGLKPFALISQLNLDALERIVFFDISAVALSYYRHLVEEWRGEPYNEWVEVLMSRAGEELQQAIRYSPDMNAHISDEDGAYTEPFRRLKKKHDNLIAFCGGEQKLLQILERIKTKRVEFKLIDVINQFEDLKIEVQAKPSLLWISNIYSYRPTFFAYGGQKGLKACFNNLVEACAHSRAAVYICGDLPSLGGVGFIKVSPLHKPKIETAMATY